MSISFRITPPAPTSQPHSPLTLREALRLGNPELFVFDLSRDELAAAVDAPLNAAPLLVGIEGVSGRGFELSYTEGAYEVREFTPATPGDWRTALEFLRDLAHHLDAPIHSEYGDTFTADTITTFDAQRDMTFGLTGLVNNSAGRPTMLSGITRTVTFTPEMFRAIADAPSPADKFGELFDKVQNEPGYTARQQLMQSPAGDIIGVYALGSEVRTVLPLAPDLEPKYQGHVDPNAVQWRVMLIVDEGEPEVVAQLPYAEAIARLPQASFTQLDGNLIVVRELTVAEVRAMAA